MRQSATIYAHPAAFRTLMDVAQLEQQTGLKAVVCLQGIKLVSSVRDYDPFQYIRALATPTPSIGDAA
ncbi:MAG: hypothetical protein ABIG70_03130 [Pseudomonadota bacterium]